MSLQRARLRMSGLGLGLENDEEKPVEGTEAPVASPEAEETVEQEVLEVTEAEGEVKEQEEAVEQLEEAAATMESLYASVKASLENGGVSAESAVYLNHAVGATLRSIGVSDTNMPSLESFGGATGKLSATKVSMESIGDWVKKIWQAIKNAVLKAIQWVKDTFAKIFGGAEKLIKRAEELEKEADKMKDTKPQDKIAFRSVSKLHTKGKADAKDFQEGLDNLEKAVTASYKEIPEASKSMVETYAKKMEEIAKASGADQANKAHNDAKVAGMSAVNKIINAVPGQQQRLSGGVNVVVDKPEADKPETAGLSLKPGQKFEQIAESQDMEALDKPAIKAMLKTVKAIAGVIKEKKTTIESMEKARKDAVESYEKAVKDIEKNKPNFIDNAIVGFMMRGIRKNYASFLTSLSAHAFVSCRAALVLCEKSIAAYGTEKK